MYIQSNKGEFMTKEKLLQAEKINNKIMTIEDEIIELEEYQKILKEKQIENIEITYKKEGSYNLLVQKEVPMKFVYEMNEKWLNELSDERNKLLKEFKEL